jgi:hypothetical protein
MLRFYPSQKYLIISAELLSKFKFRNQGLRPQGENQFILRTDKFFISDFNLGLISSVAI